MKSALVTGASEGIGRVFAKQLAAEGFAVTAVARNEAKLQSLLAEIGPHHRALVADLSTTEGQDKVIHALNETPYDLLVNNAGVGTTGAFLDVALDRQVAMLRLNIEALVRLSYTYLKTAKAGNALVNVSSTLAFLPLPGLGLYSGTKAFVTSFSESLWFEQKKRGIFVMDLCPGITTTSFHVNSGGGTLDRDNPRFSQTPEQVVAVALRALRARKKPTVISGWHNNLLASLSRLLPRRTAVSLMGTQVP